MYLIRTKLYEVVFEMTRQCCVLGLVVHCNTQAIVYILGMWWNCWLGRGCRVLKTTRDVMLSN